MNLNCEIIAVGDEVLTGDIVNTNAREIAAGLEAVSYTHLFPSEQVVWQWILPL